MHLVPSCSALTLPLPAFEKLFRTAPHFRNGQDLNMTGAPSGIEMDHTSMLYDAAYASDGSIHFHDLDIQVCRASNWQRHLEVSLPLLWDRVT